MEIAIVGGGAAGMMAAATIVEHTPSASIALIEPNSRLGEKVRRTGGGRCNLTTGLTDMEAILRRYPRGRNFLKHAFYDFPPWKVMEWFESHGVPLKIEADFRVFPQSDRSDDVVAVFEKVLGRPNVKIRFGCSVEKVDRQGKRFILKLSDSENLEADRLLIACGGQVGSNGSGYELAKSLGHTITPMAPSLASLIASEPWAKALSGVSFQSARLRLKASKEHTWVGPFVFTHKGVTGPAIFALSSMAAYEIMTSEHPARLLIDLLPEVSESSLAQQLQEGIAVHPKKTFENLLTQWAPKSVATVLCQILGIPAERIAVEVSRKDLNKSVTWLKGIPLTIVGRAAGEEFVTAGGVDLKEVDSKTMQSKLCQGLFFSGEVLDIDAFTGGFNLQAAWATGRSAGKNMI